jgi:hypothetical protein
MTRSTPIFNLLVSLPARDLNHGIDPPFKANWFYGS